MTKFAGQIWLDVSILSETNGKMHGIARCEIELIRTSMTDSDVRYFNWGPTGAFIPVDKETVLSLLTSEPELRSKAVVEHKPKSMESVVRFLYSWVFSKSGKQRLFWASTAYLALFSWRLLFQNHQNLVRLFADLRKNVAAEKNLYKGVLKPETSSWIAIQLPQKIDTDILPIQRGDVLISIGLLWKRTNMTKLYLEKKKYGFHIVSNIYDLIPIRFPELAYAPHLQDFYKGVIDTLWISDAILVNSEFVRDDLHKFAKSTELLKVPNVVKNTLGTDHLPKPDIGDLPRHLEQINFIVYVSTIEKRKNHAVLVEAYKRMIASSQEDLPTLIFAGSIGWGVDDLIHEIQSSNELIQSGVRKIILMTNLKDGEVSWLLKNAKYTVFPSQVEGWGLPISESIRSGTPVLASNHPSLREAGGESAHYLAPNDEKAWQSKMSELNKIPKLEPQILVESLPTWSEFASTCLKIGRELYSNE